ncbi:MAG: hypothetical protein WD557_15465 [Dehalococcoidia bacterium]
MNRTLSLSVLGAVVCAILGATLLLGARSQAAGPNLLINGDFSQGATGWTPVTQAIVASTPTDTLWVEDIASGPDMHTDGGTQCVSAIDHRFEHTFGVDGFIPTGQGRDGHISMWVYSYSGLNCGGTFLGIESPPTAIITDGVWENRTSTFVPPDDTHSFWVVLLVRKHAASPGDNPDGSFIGNFDNALVEKGAQVKNLPDPYETPTPTPPPGEDRSITVCAEIDPNGDADTESGTYIRSLFVQGNPVPVHQSFANPFEGQPADCLPLDLATLGVANETAFTVTQTLAPFTQAAGYPKHDIGVGFVSGDSVNFDYPLGSGDNFQVTFANKEAAAEPPTHSLKICKFIEDNGDGVDDSAAFTFQVGFDFQAPFLADFPVQAVEGSAVCELVDLIPYGVQPSGGPLLRVTENPLAGWTNQAGYPTFSANGGPLHVGTFAGMANLPNDAENIGPFIDFSNKRVAGEGGDPQPPDPTPTPPPPTETPTPPAPPPDPTETPTPPPPTPTGTPTPPADDPDPDPTGTPTPPADDPDPDPTGTPTPPPGNPAPDPTGTPTPPDDLEQQDGGTPASETATDDGSEGPLPPSTGKGLAPSRDGSARDSVIGVVLVALGALSTAGSLAWRKAAGRAR